MPRKTKAVFRVSLTLPLGCSVGRAQEYVRDAISSWFISAYVTDDPMAHLDWTTVKVVRIKEKERGKK